MKTYNGVEGQQRARRGRVSRGHGEAGSAEGTERQGQPDRLEILGWN